jgi:tight adherence protein B
MLLVLLAFVFGVAVVYGGYTAATRLPQMLEQRRLERRLTELSAAPDAATEEHSDGLVKAVRAGALPILDRMLGNTERGSAFARWLEQSGAKVSPSGVFVIAAAVAALLALVAGMLTHSVWGWVAGGVLGCALPFIVLNGKRTRRMRAFEEQFPEGLDLISRALKAGHAFATGLKMVADEMAEPVGPEFRKTFDEQNFGLPLKDALANLTVRIPLLDVRFFSTAVLIQRETGGNLSEILENLAHVVRERFKILRQVRVYTAHGRLTGYVLLGLPVFLAIALAFINPEHMQLLFTEKMGHMMLGATVIMQTVGYFWIKQVIKIEV